MGRNKKFDNTGYTIIEKIPIFCDKGDPVTIHGWANYYGVAINTLKSELDRMGYEFLTVATIVKKKEL